MNDDMKLAKEVRDSITSGDVEKVFTLLGTEKGRLEISTPFGTWLHVAAAHNKLDIVKRLISLGADIDRKGGILGGSALNEAASDGHVEIVAYLLAHGASIDVTEPQYNPLFGAIHGGHLDIAKLLIEHGMDTRVKYTGENMKDMDALAFSRE